MWPAEGRAWLLADKLIAACHGFPHAHCVVDRRFPRLEATRVISPAYVHHLPAKRAASTAVPIRTAQRPYI
jgi:hypothetical protein